MRGKGTRSVFAIVSALLLLTSLAAAKSKKASHKRAATTHKSAHKSTHKTRRSRHSRRMAWKYRGQQKPDAQRAREIQEALVRENYLRGEPTGVWDQATRNAMARFQEDHGWQTRMVPDARALIALGLGPSHNGLLNPETAMTSNPILAGGSADGDLPASGAPYRQ